MANSPSWQGNYKKPESFIVTNNHTTVSSEELITPESNLISGFLVEVQNKSTETTLDLITNASQNYFSSHNIEIKNIILSPNTYIFYLSKQFEDQDFYEKFTKVVSWFMLNRKDSTVVIRPIIENTNFIANRALIFDKPQVITNDLTNKFLDPQTAILDGYHIHIDYLKNQDQQAEILFNQFKDYISQQRLIYSDLDWYPLDSNGPHARAGWEIKFEKAGTNLNAYYGKALIWLLLNHGDIPLYSHSKNWIFGENEQRLISHLDNSLYSGAPPKLKQQFFYDPENVNSGLYRWDQQLATTKFISKHESLLKQQEIIDFWFSESIKPQWFRKQDTTTSSLDETIKQKFAKDLFLLVNGYYNSWLTTLDGKLAYIIITDQFSRNIYRGTPMVLAYDKLALDVAKSVIKSGDDKKLTYNQRVFVYLPFVHSEEIVNQNIGVELFKLLRDEVPDNLTAEFDVHYQQALKHKAVIEKFNHFIHRNKTIFSLELTDEEVKFLENQDATF